MDFTDVDKLIMHYEQILREKNKEIAFLKRLLLKIRRSTNDPKIKRMSHFPPYQDP